MIFFFTDFKNGKREAFEASNCRQLIVQNEFYSTFKFCIAIDLVNCWNDEFLNCIAIKYIKKRTDKFHFIPIVIHFDGIFIFHFRIKTNSSSKERKF